eukprot:SAG11_NODE_10579_length_819_cov_2.015278_1_plen_110_part_00
MRKTKICFEAPGGKTIAFVFETISMLRSYQELTHRRNRKVDEKNGAGGSAAGPVATGGGSVPVSGAGGSAAGPVATSGCAGGGGSVPVFAKTVVEAGATVVETGVLSAA